MTRGAVIVALLLAGFAGGWFTHQETQSKCYVLPGYTQSSNPFLPRSTRAPELVCK